MSFKPRHTLVALAFLFVAMGASAQLSDDDCVSCHGDASADKPIDAKQFTASVHAPLGCTACHADIAAYPHEPVPAHVDCSSCHTEEAAAWNNSRHARAFKAGNRNAAGCLSCHGGNAHAILLKSDPKSPTFHANIPTTCGRCHSQKFVMESSGVSTTPTFSYQQSIHGRAIANGSEKAAVCSDCHGSHEVLGANDQKSSIFKFNIPRTCGKCHTGVVAQYTQSIHGRAVARGNDKAPVCTDCHGIHLIKSHIDPTSSVASQNIARTTCGQCHGNVQLSKEFGIAAGRVTSYEESYHGLAKRLGSAEAANCASCHGVHNILPASDPKSQINKANLAATCGKCHPGAGAKFVTGRLHLGEGPAKQSTGDIVIRWVRRIYIPLIFLTIGGMALHQIIIWVRKARRARRDPTRTVVRMNRNQRIQHSILLTSFLVLVITGFALAWPNSFFATIAGNETVRRTIHRIAAVVMLILGLYHLAYMFGTKEGRKGLKDFWFTPKDPRDAIGVVKYNLGLTSEHPKMGRFTYAEKAEYWALVWGTIVMGLTGLMLWFELQVTSWLHLARWWIDVATLVHYYEAILATLAIIIWHLYAVIFDPDVYPINWAWFDGKMTESQFRHEHEAEYEKTLPDARHPLPEEPSEKNESSDQ